MAVQIHSTMKPKPSSEQYFLIESDDVDVSAGTGVAGTSLTQYIEDTKEILDGITGDGIVVVPGAVERLDVADTGDENTPVYFKDGVPVVCTGLDLDTTGSAAKLNVADTGNENTPVYFANGVPVACSALNAGGGEADTAAKLTTEGHIQVNLASSDSPLYTEGGDIAPGVTGTLGIKNGGTGNEIGRVQIGQKSDVAVSTYATSEGCNTNACLRAKLDDDKELTRFVAF